MKDSFSKKTNTYLNPGHTELGFILQKTKELSELNKKLASFLNPNTAALCRVGNRIGDTLVIIVANGSVATELRFQTPHLLQKFQSDPVLSKIQHIRCKVYPELNNRFKMEENKPMQAGMQTLSQETAALIYRMAQSIEHSKLKTIMENIAKHKKG